MGLMGKPHSRVDLVPWGFLLPPWSREGKEPPGREKCSEVCAFFASQSSPVQPGGSLRPGKLRATYPEETEVSQNRAGSTSYLSARSLKAFPKQVTDNSQLILFPNPGKEKPLVTPSSQMEQLKQGSGPGPHGCGVGEWALAQAALPPVPMVFCMCHATSKYPKKE